MKAKIVSLLLIVFILASISASAFAARPMPQTVMKNDWLGILGGGVNAIIQGLETPFNLWASVGQANIEQIIKVGIVEVPYVFKGHDTLNDAPFQPPTGYPDFQSEYNLNGGS